MSADFLVLVSEEYGFGSLRFWAVEGDADTAERIEEITGCSTRLVSVLSFDSFLNQIGIQDPLTDTIVP